MLLLFMENSFKQFVGLWLTSCSLSDALASVGFRCIGLPWGTDTNPKTETGRAEKNRPRIQVVDWVYKSQTLPHTNLQDPPSIVISGVQVFKQYINIYIYIYNIMCC